MARSKDKLVLVYQSRIEAMQNPPMSVAQHNAYLDQKSLQKAEQTLNQRLCWMMSQEHNRANIPTALCGFFQKFKGTPREQEARQAIEEWLERNGIRRKQ